MCRFVGGEAGNGGVRVCKTEGIFTGDGHVPL